METLDLRARRQSEIALEVARFLEPRVPQLLYPGLPSHPQHDLAARQMTAGGTIFSMVLEGGREQAWAFLDALELIDISNNIGDSRSLLCHPATSTPDACRAGCCTAMGVAEGMVRMNVGLEDPQDLMEDLDQALRKVGL